MRGLDGLRSLELSGCGELEGLPATLEELTLNAMKHIDFGQISGLTSLRRLTVSECFGREAHEFWDSDVEDWEADWDPPILAPPAGMSSLRELELVRCTISGEHRSELCAATQLSALRLRSNREM